MFMLRITSLLLASVLLTSAKAETSAISLDKRIRELAPDLIDATVGLLLGGGSGSGVIVSPDGLVLTAAHVTVTPNTAVTVLLADGREVSATSLGVDHSTDAALLQITTPGPYPYRPYVREKTYQPGDWCLALGHPGGPILGRRPPVRLGEISHAGTGSGFTDAIVTNATVISGDSGGPLFDLEGRVIGINSNISGSWATNRHVPLPAFIEAWDELMAGETIGSIQQSIPDDPSEQFTDPYAGLREDFLQAVKEHPDDSFARDFSRRPRLLPPHRMQAFLDQFSEPKPETAVPRLGLRFDLSEAGRCLIVEVEGAAKDAGLRPGQTLTSLEERSITSPASFALAFSEFSKRWSPGEPLEMTVDGVALRIVPNSASPRGHFPMPVTGLISMSVRGGIEGDDSLQGRRDLETTAAGTFSQVSRSVIPVRGEGRRRPLAQATVIAPGVLVSKASELEKSTTTPFVVINGSNLPLSQIASDEQRDLIFLSVESGDLEPLPLPVEAETPPGSVIFSATGEGFSSGIITQALRSSPDEGMEAEHSGGEARVWMGLTFSPAADEAVIQRIAPGSPADRAGLLEGDTISSFAGTAIETPDELAELLATKAPEQGVQVGYRRDGIESEVRIILQERPLSDGNTFSRQSLLRDAALENLSASGGSLSERSRGFPLCLYHDAIIHPSDCGGPLLDARGAVVGITIARTFRHRSLAIPIAEVMKSWQEIQAR